MGTKATNDTFFNRMDRETIAYAKAQIVKCENADQSDVFYVVGGCQELLRQLVRLAERRMEAK